MLLEIRITVSWGGVGWEVVGREPGVGASGVMGMDVVCWLHEWVQLVKIHQGEHLRSVLFSVRPIKSF